MRPDRPPGRDATSGPALTPPGRPLNASTGIVQRGAGSDRARAAEKRLCLAWWADGYRIGFEAGEQVGARRTAREWHVTAAGLPLAAIGPLWAELERRRWGPGGRLHFGDPRPGDFPGRDDRP